MSPAAKGMGKAGGYAIQGRAEAFVRFLSGSHSGVVGLPLFETRALLDAPPGDRRLPEWLYEAGIGEARAALVEDDRIVEAAIEPDDDGLRVGASPAPGWSSHPRPGRAGRHGADGTDARTPPAAGVPKARR